MSVDTTDRQEEGTGGVPNGQEVGGTGQVPNGQELLQALARSDIGFSSW
ncbi:MAG: hypothetical protein RBU37_17725 [Myxococcota bacterium]|nr:hypothetical protein [Myxococcota bacterium]